MTYATGFSRGALLWSALVGLGGTMADECTAPFSKNCSLASNLQAQQQGFAFQQSYSSEKFSPRLQILNRRQPYSMV